MRPLRRALTALALAGLVGCAVCLALRWVDSAAVPVVVVQSALPLVGLAAVVATLVLVALRRPWLAAAGLVLSVGFGATALPALRRSTVPASEHDLVVVSINLQYGRGDAADVMAEVRRRNADVVVLVEVTNEAMRRLDAAGLAAWPAQTGIPLEDAAGLVVRSRLPLEPIDWGPDYPQPWTGAVGRLTTPAGPVIVRGIHTNAPNLHEAQKWRRSMSAVAAWARDRHPGQPVLMAGDFNAGWGHPAFRAIAEGYTDAHRAAADGWVRTWPVGSTVPPFTQLDHVLVRGMDVVDAGTFAVRHTDHRGVWARLHLR